MEEGGGGDKNFKMVVVCWVKGWMPEKLGEGLCHPYELWAVRKLNVYEILIETVMAMYECSNSSVRV